MRKPRMILTLVLCAILLAGCGNIRSAQRHIINTGDFSNSEVRHAMSLVSRYFAWHFEGCTLLELRYDAAETEAQETVWAKELGGEVIVLHTSFKTDHNGGDGSLNPNSIYEDYQWVLVKNSFGLWDLESWGYA